MVTDNREALTPKEFEQMQYEERMFDKQAAFQLEMAKYETKWASLFKIPITIIFLPVFCLMAIGYIISSARKHEPSENFWKFMRR